MNSQLPPRVWQRRHCFSSSANWREHDDWPNSKLKALDFVGMFEVGISSFRVLVKTQYHVRVVVLTTSNCAKLACNRQNVSILTFQGPRLRPAHAFTIDRAPRLQIVCR